MEKFKFGDKPQTERELLFMVEAIINFYHEYSEKIDERYHIEYEITKEDNNFKIRVKWSAGEKYTSEFMADSINDSSLTEWNLKEDFMTLLFRIENILKEITEQEYYIIEYDD